MALNNFVSFSETLTKKITTQTASVLGLAVICISVVGISEVYNLSSSNAANSLHNSCIEIEKSLTDVESASRVLEAAVHKSDYDLADLTKYLLQVDSNIISCAVAYEPFVHDSGLEYYMSMSFKDSTGTIVNQEMGGEEFDYFLQDWYQIPQLTGKSVWNEPSFDLAGTSMATSYSVPLYDDNGAFVGVLRLAVSLDWLSGVVNSYRPYESAVTLVISRAGSFMTHLYIDHVLSETVYTESIASQNEKLLKKCKKVMSGETGSLAYPTEGTVLHMQYESLSNGWVVVGLCSYLDFFGPINRVIILLCIFGILGILFQYFSVRRMIKLETKPIITMTYAAQNMARGNFNAKIPIVKNNDEIKKLETSIHLLQKTITKYIAELKSTTIKQERIESELSVANDIQMSFLPHEFPSCREFECFATLIPAKSVGGDLYDFKRIGNTLFFAVGDVSGKGVPAALFMAITKSAFNFVKTKRTDEIAYSINNAFVESNEGGMFVTLFVGKVNLETMEMEYCNGGHNPIIVVEPDGKARFIHAKPNLALGLFPDFKFESETLQLSRGCRIIAYTDGISEAENREKELFGDDRLLAFANTISDEMASKDVADALLDNVHEFTDGNEQNDDMTIFTVKF